jgi:hypothetical protein
MTMLWWGNLTDGKRTFRMHGWEDEIKMDVTETEWEYVEGIHIAQGWDK